MMTSAVDKLPRASSDPDDRIVTRVLSGDTEQFAILIRRYNSRLFRVARAITRDDAEAEDIVQHTFVAAFQKLGQWQGRAQLSTWLATIARNEAFARYRRSRRGLEVVSGEPGDGVDRETPEGAAMRREAIAVLEAAVDDLAEAQRSVFVLRDVEGMSTGETAEVLGLSESAVRVRLFRARAALRQRVLEHFEMATGELFSFAGARCDRIVGAVWSALHPLDPHVAAEAGEGLDQAVDDHGGGGDGGDATDGAP